MKITKYHWIAGLLVLVIVVLAGLLGFFIGNRNLGYRTIADGIVIADDGESHESVMLTAYTEYTDLLNDLGIAKDVFLTAGDFDDYDYIIDYIYYEDDLVIDKINLDITDDGVVIEYIVNKEITESNELLIYFIRIEKDSLSDYEFASRRFELN